jgi:hypothetical protein
MYEVQRVLDLPVQELAEMLAESETAGFRAIDRLINDWRTGANRFDCPGEALFLAKQENLVIGICGLNRDPYTNSDQIGRIRRLICNAERSPSGNWTNISSPRHPSSSTEF